MALAAAFDLLTIGAPNDQSNFFPFGGGTGVGGTRYQQAYSATQFAGVGTSLIRSVRFVGGAGTLAASTYAFHLSTITTGIDNLSLSNFDANRGADDDLFAARNLSGAAPSTLTIDGSVPFLYDPSRGNLLLDITISPAVMFAPGGAFYGSRSGTAVGIFSRYHNFGTAFIGWGLVTQFELVRATADNLGAVVDEAIAAGRLTGVGGGNSAGARLEAWRRLVGVAERLTAEGNAHGACAVLNQVYRGIDGEPAPPDAVSGMAASVVARFIAAIQEEMGC